MSESDQEGCPSQTASPAPAADGTGWPTSGSGLVLTHTERSALQWFAEYGGPPHRAIVIRRLLERLT